MGGRRRPHAAETQRARCLLEAPLGTGLRTPEDLLPKEGRIWEDRFQDASGGFLSGPRGGRGATKATSVRLLASPLRRPLLVIKHYYGRQGDVHILEATGSLHSPSPSSSPPSPPSPHLAFPPALFLWLPLPRLAISSFRHCLSMYINRQNTDLLLR